METKIIDISLIEPNNGQVPGLPRNPRLWSVKELAKLKKSIQETPELVELRPPIVIANGDKYVVVGGNMRLAALQELGTEKTACLIIPEGTPASTVKEIAIKDNSQFGEWDYDALANDWDDFELADYGIPVFDNQPETTVPGDGNAKPLDDRRVIEIELTPNEFQFVTSKLRALGGTMEEAVLNLFHL